MMRYDWSYGPAVVETVDNFQNVVVKINWICMGYDDTARNYKASGVAPSPPIDPTHYVPFDQLTKQQIETWVFATVSKTEVEYALLQQSKVQPDVKPFNF